MDEDSIILNLYHGGKYVKWGKSNYEDGTYRIIDHVEIDKLFFWELKCIAKEVGNDNVVEFFYLILGHSTECGLRRVTWWWWCN